MDEQRVQAYLQLISKLLTCPNGKELEILQQNYELVDADFLKITKLYAEKLKEDGEERSAAFLFRLVEQLIKQSDNYQPNLTHFNLLLAILSTITNSEGKEQVYSLLQQNLSLIDINLAEALESFVTKTLSARKTEEKKALGYVIGNFLSIIQEFPFGNKRNNLEIAIRGYQTLIIIFSELDLAISWAEMQYNLGIAYFDRISGNRKNNIELAINSYQLALRVYSEVDFPQQWAVTQNNLGNAYSDRISGDKKDNLESAIACYTAALKVRTGNNFPIDWAVTQHNLGAAYSNRISGDRVENLEKALICHIAALKVRTQENSPINWAMSQNNLSAIYIKRFRGNRKENIELAIIAQNSALRVYTEADFPQQWAMTQNNLGIAYLDRIAGNRRDNIELAIAAQNFALRIYTEADFPQQWAMTHDNLGTAYLYRIAGNRRENLELAITAYITALRVYTKADFPQQWAMTQNNLGIAYRDRIAGDKRENLKRAIACYTAALRMHTPQSDPTECLRIARNLGSLQFTEGNWQFAIETYTLAIKAVEQNRQWASNNQNKQEIISNAIEVYQNIVQACINLGQIDKAIEYVERGKARNLVDLLATRDLYPKGDIPQEVIDRLDFLRQEAIAEERRLSQQRDRRNGFSDFSMGDNRGLESAIGNNEAINRDRLNNIRQELDNLVKKDILPVDPSFQLTQKVEPISFDKIRASLPSNKTVLIEWFIGKETLSVFIVAAHMEQPLLISYSAEEYQVLFDIFGRYLDTYQQRDRQWHNQLDNLLVELAQSLKIVAVIEQIEKLIPDCDRLILVPHRWLHLLPIHALPLADGKCLLDLFPKGVSYAPSVQLLELTQKQSKPQLNNLFAVQNPTEDLEFTDVEVKAVRSQFQPNDDVLTKQQATKSALNKERLGQANAAHFSCHGYFNFENPELSALLLAGSKVEKNKEGENKSETRFLPSRDGGSIDLEHCLTLGEIFSLDLRNCRLVTLSACETGLTDFKSLSDEYIGLPSGFLYAGSPSVVSSLWAVNDISTSFLMIKFYQNLQEIDSVAIALNQAQLWLRSVTKEELYAWSETLPLPIYERIPYFDAALQKLAPNTIPYASPYFWGAFCAVGS